MRGARQLLGQAHDVFELGVLRNIGEGDRPLNCVCVVKADYRRAGRPSARRPRDRHQHSLKSPKLGSPHETEIYVR
jgi:hypothetical protein